MYSFSGGGEKKNPIFKASKNKIKRYTSSTSNMLSALTLLWKVCINILFYTFWNAAYTHSTADNWIETGSLTVMFMNYPSLLLSTFQWSDNMCNWQSKVWYAIYSTQGWLQAGTPKVSHFRSLYILLTDISFEILGEELLNCKSCNNIGQHKLTMQVYMHSSRDLNL